MAKANTPPAINAFVPEEVDARARELQTAGLSPGDMKVVVYWLNNVGDSSGMRLPGEIDYTLFSDETVAEKWNRGGSFRACLQSRTNGPDGIFKGNLKVWRFGLDETMVRPTTSTAIVPTTTAPTFVPGAGLDMNSLMLAMMKNQSDVQLALLNRSTQQQPAAASAMLPIITALAPIFGPSLAKAFFDKTPASDVLALFDAISNRAKKMGAGAGGGGDDAGEGEAESFPGAALARDAIKLLTLAIEKTAKPKAAEEAKPQAASFTPSPNAAHSFTVTSETAKTEAAPATTPGAENVFDVTKMTRQLTFASEAVEGLIARAKAAKPDAIKAADFVTERAAANKIDIGEHLRSTPEAFVSQLIEKFSQAAPHRAFLVEVASELKARAMNAKFSAAVVRGLLDIASDDEPSIDAGAALVESCGERFGIEPDSFASPGEYVGELASAFPAVTEHRGFFLSVFEAVKERASDEPEDDDTK